MGVKQHPKRRQSIGGLIRGGMIILCFFAGIILSVWGVKKTATVYFERGKYVCVLNVFDQKNGLACGEYDHGMNETGWNQLKIWAESDSSDLQKAHAIGYLEGCLTHESISDHWKNIRSWMLEEYNGTIPTILSDFFQKQRIWMEDMISDLSKSDPFWNGINLVHEQFLGLIQGFEFSSEVGLDYDDFQILSFGDVFTLKRLVKSERKSPRKTTHCSALIKINYDYSDIFVGHNTWFHYPAMLRNEITRMSFSSYPGTISSQDDFYVLSPSNLYVMETSYEIYHEYLVEEFVQPQSLFTWHRCVVSNLLSSTGSDWIGHFSRYNSGTYNNMWLILDMKLFDAGKSLKPGLLTILEQAPGKIVTKDATSTLSLGSFPSFNAPYTSEIAEWLGYDLISSTSDDFYLWNFEISIRHKMHRRDVGKITDLHSFRSFLRYSDWRNDPLANGDPGHTIAPRFELRPSKSDSDFLPGCWGNLDAKVISVNEWTKDGKIHMISGPPRNNGYDGPFEWTKADVCHKYSFHGIPSKFDFDWIEYTLSL